MNFEPLENLISIHTGEKKKKKTLKWKPGKLYFSFKRKT